MGSLVKHVMTVMERIAPLRLAEKWDKVSQKPFRSDLPELKADRSGRASRGLAFITLDYRLYIPFRPDRVPLASFQQTTSFVNH